jgi:hypothetical protein
MLTGICLALSGVKLPSGLELKRSIGPSQRSLQATVEKVAGLDHHDAGCAAVRVAVGQPEEGHGLSVAGRNGWREGRRLLFVCRP